eukprot:1086837-Amphidinium_carterae.2
MLQASAEGSAADGMEVHSGTVDQGLQDEKEAVSMLTHELLEARGYEDWELKRVKHIVATWAPNIVKVALLQKIPCIPC